LIGRFCRHTGRTSIWIPPAVQADQKPYEANTLTDFFVYDSDFQYRSLANYNTVGCHAQLGLKASPI
jgi:hypothetical protein